MLASIYLQYWNTVLGNRQHFWRMCNTRYPGSVREKHNHIQNVLSNLNDSSLNIVKCIQQNRKCISFSDDMNMRYHHLNSYCTYHICIMYTLPILYLHIYHIYIYNIIFSSATAESNSHQCPIPVIPKCLRKYPV